MMNLQNRPYTEVESEFHKSEIYKLAQETHIPHTACPVPSAMIKAVEVAGGLGLKRDIQIRFMDDDEDVSLRTSLRASRSILRAQQTP